MRHHLIVRPIELRSAHAGERVLQYLLRKGICLVKLLQMTQKRAYMWSMMTTGALGSCA
jgi:hypothetical protein